MPIKLARRLHPSQTIILAVTIVITLGFALLSLPAAQRIPISFIDLLFTTVSVTTGTSLMCVPISYFTTFGHVILLGLMQLGALSVLLLTFLFIYLFVSSRNPGHHLSVHIFYIEHEKNIKQVILWIVGATIIIEFFGACALFLSFKTMMSTTKACWYAIFHSASAFANSGLSLFDQSMEPFFQKPALLNTLSILMLMGSIGFVTLSEILYSFPALVGRRIYYYTLESKIIWITASLLLSITCFLFFFLELHTVFATTPLLISLSNTLFSSLSAMGTGFTSIHPLMLKPTTLLVIMAVAFIGTSPGSTGSGIHTTTAAILVATVKAIILKRKQVFLLGKKITQAQIYKATTIVALGISWVMLSTFMLTITDPDHDFLGLFFEAVSAFATLGISLDITPHLSILGKTVIMLSMIFGRLGPLTIFFAIKDSVAHDTHNNINSPPEQHKNQGQTPE